MDQLYEGILQKAWNGLKSSGVAKQAKQIYKGAGQFYKDYAKGVGQIYKGYYKGLSNLKAGSLSGKNNFQDAVDRFNTVKQAFTRKPQVQEEPKPTPTPKPAPKPKEKPLEQVTDAAETVAKKPDDSAEKAEATNSQLFQDAATAAGYGSDW